MKKDKFILLRKTKYRESDLIITGLSSRGAKMTFIARGAARSRKRFGGGALDPTNYILASFAEAKERRAGSMHVLNEATILTEFRGLKKTYERLELAFHLVGLVDRIAQEGEIDSENLFHLLGNALKACEVSVSLPQLKTQFEVKLLAYQGVLPEMEGAGEFLKRSLAEHSEVDLESSQMGRLQGDLRRTFEAYLNRPVAGL